MKNQHDGRYPKRRQESERNEKKKNTDFLFLAFSVLTQSKFYTEYVFGTIQKVYISKAGIIYNNIVLNFN